MCSLIHKILFETRISLILSRKPLAWYGWQIICAGKPICCFIAAISDLLTMQTKFGYYIKLFFF